MESKRYGAKVLQIFPAHLNFTGGKKGKKEHRLKWQASPIIFNVVHIVAVARSLIYSNIRRKKRVTISHFAIVGTSTFRAWERFFPLIRVGRATWSIKRKLSNFHIRFWGVLGVVIVFIWKWMPIRPFVVYIQSYIHIYADRNQTSNSK